MPPAPPLSLSIQQSSPNFAALYEQLTTKLLTPSCGSLPTEEEKTKDAVLDRELRVHAATLTKARILERAVRDGQLPEEISAVVALHLNPPPPPQEMRDLPPLPNPIPLAFKLPPAALLPPDIPPSHLPYTLAQRLSSLSPPSPTALLHRLSTLTALHSALLHLLTQLLSQTRPSHTRTLLARLTFLSRLTHGLSSKLRLLHLTLLGTVYGPPNSRTHAALRNYRAHLLDTKTRLVARRRVVEGEVKRWEGIDGGLVERYAKVGRRVEQVRGEIRKLGGDA